MGAVLIIAEKPDQGATLASIFNIKKHQGYLEILPNELFPEGAYVTWAIGHLCQLVAPEKYNNKWKRWSLQTLPIFPEKFEYEVTKSKGKQFAIVKKLVTNRNVTEIIHAGDAGREGELIIRNILRLCKTNKPMKRLWISSLTEKAIYEGFQNLLTETDTRTLYYEAYTRACADWLVGMNASRLYSLLLQKQGLQDVFSVGRVQTPTLALIVKREREIENFVSKPFWEVMAQFLVNGKRYWGKWEQDNNSKMDTAEMATKIARFCEQKPAEVTEVKVDKKAFHPPQLYNLSALQADANRQFKFPPKKTLDVLQGLYQKGFVSYPRSDSRFVTQGEAEMFPLILQKLAEQLDYATYFPVPKQSIVNNKRYVNEKKVTDHYAIIPTEKVPDVTKLPRDEKRLYDLIVKTLIAAHYPKSIAEYTTITTLVDGRATFFSKGKHQVEAGWRKVIPLKEKNPEQTLPKLAKGETGKVEKVETKAGKTEPPKRYTEGQLITLMKTAGKHVDDKELEQVLMKTEGLGTEATRAGIIMMLKERNYITITKNTVYPTAKGKILIDAAGEQILASPEMTAKWEQRLTEISAGTASPRAFIEQTKKMITHLVETTEKQANWDFKQADLDAFIPSKRRGRGRRPFTKLGSCKKCGGSVIDKGNFYGCSNYAKTKCNFTISKKMLGKTITQKNVEKLLSDGETEMISGFQGKDKRFDARVVWDPKQQKIIFSFENE